jgi:membrane protein implicated in regulation of membrane protease activity
MDWWQDNAWAIWLGLTILLGAGEIFSASLVMAMLAVGTTVALLAAVVGLPVAVQVIAAAATSIAMLAFLRPNLVRRLNTGPELRLGHGKLVGRQAMVIQDVSALAPGRVKLAGEIWSAEPYDDTLTIAAGSTVEVFEIRGATAYVHPIPELGP